MHPDLDLACMALASLLFASILHALYLWYRLCHIPGPFWGSFTSSWIPRNYLGGQWTWDLNKASNQYGDVVRVGPNLLITNDVYSLLQLAPPEPKYPWGFLHHDSKAKDCLNSSALSIDEQDRFANLQSLFAPGPMGDLQIEERVNRQCARLFNLVEREFISTSVDHRPMNLVLVVHQFAMNVLGELLWGQLLRILGQETGADTPKGGAMEEFLNQLAVCTEATTTAICTTLAHLLGSPVAYSRLQAEIDASVSRVSASQTITDAEARRLPYLQATIKEGRRTCPAYTAPFFERVPGGGHTISGYRVPEGTGIGPNMTGIMRSKKYWGQDAEVFRPERWLEAEATASRAMHDTLEVFWTLGRYTSLGISITQMVLNKTFPEVRRFRLVCHGQTAVLTSWQLLRRFDFALLHPLPPWDTGNPAFWITSGPLVRVTTRARAL